MIKIYSKIEKDKLLFTLQRKQDINSSRIDLSPDEEFLQFSTKKLNAGDFFKPHKHLPCKKIVTITQEAWIILDGSVEAIFYDLDDKEIFKEILNSGDCIVIFAGGHSLKSLTKDAILYEIKNGPYFGVEKDKEYLNTDEKNSL